MPTPFTHLAVAARLLDDPAVPAPIRAELGRERGAFLLGNIAADARVSSGVQRENTHFYAYNRPIVEHPWRVMLDAYPALKQVGDAAQQAFLAGYVAHLVMDEVWTVELVRPVFVEQEWAPGPIRFRMLNVLLVWMDLRDYPTLPRWEREALESAAPCDWSPFLDDPNLCAWRDLIARQLVPGKPETIEIISERVGLTPAELTAILESPEALARDLWGHVDPALVGHVETLMYDRARATMIDYLTNTESNLEAGV